MARPSVTIHDRFGGAAPSGVPSEGVTGTPNAVPLAPHVATGSPSPAPEPSPESPTPEASPPSEKKPQV